MPVIFSFGLIVRAMRCRARNLHVFVSLGTNGYALPLLLAAAHVTACHNLFFIGEKSGSCKLHCLQDYDYGYKNIATSTYRQQQRSGNKTMLLLTSVRMHASFDKNRACCIYKKLVQLILKRLAGVLKACYKQTPACLHYLIGKKQQQALKTLLLSIFLFAYFQQLKSSRMRLLFSLLLLYCVHCSFAQQASPVHHIFPQGTTVHANVPYAGDTLQKHLLDIYLPQHATANTPLIVWVHGGAWMLNDKYADMGYMQQTIQGFLQKGYALASVDYRHSTTAPFPAQVQDLNTALQFLHNHAAQYKLDKRRMALIGFSAGGHLASLLALSHNNKVPGFNAGKTNPAFSIRCVLDFYGPSDLIAIDSSPDTTVNNARHPVAMLIGAIPVDRPDLARRASPVTYIDKNDPPFFIVQGERDESVPNTQSRLLHASLGLAGVKSELVMVPGAPHYGVMFDAAWIREKAMEFLDKYLR
jgi:acetyl esterase/lipase